MAHTTSSSLLIARALQRRRLAGLARLRDYLRRGAYADRRS